MRQILFLPFLVHGQDGLESGSLETVVETNEVQMAIPPITDLVNDSENNISTEEVEEKANEIEPELPVPDNEKSQCEKELDATNLSEFPQVGRFVPSCDKTGKYSALQCHGSSGQCWCADEKGTEMPGTRSQPGDSPPACDSLPMPTEVIVEELVEDVPVVADEMCVCEDCSLSAIVPPAECEACPEPVPVEEPICEPELCPEIVTEITAESWEVTYDIEVVTGNKYFGGTDDSIYIQMIGETGQTDYERLYVEHRNDFERGQTSSFALTKPYKGALQEVKLLKTGCDFWYVDSVKINFEDKSANSTVVENTFTCGTEKVNESAPFNVCKLT